MDPEGIFTKERDEKSDVTFDVYFSWLYNRYMVPNGGGSGYGLPGQVRKGKGLNGVYWDWDLLPTGLNLIMKKFLVQYLVDRICNLKGEVFTFA